MNKQETIPFQTETVKLLQMMIHSVYTTKEVFLRELIANASDAIDKRFALALEHPDDKIGPVTRESYMIRITPNKEKRLLTISDNGIGMDADDLRRCLGTIAFSGSGLFQEETQHADDLIGKFGIGFYSLFMAADHVKVVSKKAGTEQAWIFESDGIDSYSITEGKRSECGTDVILHIREETAEGADEYNCFLREYPLYKLVKKYSDYIRWPIRLLMPIPVPDENGEPTEKWSYELLNSMTPLWKRQRSEVKEEETLAFFREHYAKPSEYETLQGAAEPPLRTLLLRIEGNVEFSALIYIPSSPWKTYDTKEDVKGLELYSSGIRVREAAEELLPSAYPFLKGAVDCADLPLNITRENLQSNAEIAAIRDVIERKTTAALMEAMQNNRTDYERFFQSFGKSLKLSAMETEGSEREKLQKLLLFEVSDQEGLISLEEYEKKMIHGQKAVYFAKGNSRTEILSLPESERPRRRGIPFLCAVDMVDELCARVFVRWKNYPFVSLSDRQADLLFDAGSPFSKEETDELLQFIKTSIGNEAAEVIASRKLESHPVLLSSGSGISFEMERDYQKQNPDAGIGNHAVLEVNLSHPALRKLNSARKSDPKRAVSYAVILYNQARMMAGLPIKDPVTYTDLLTDLFTE